ncbi:MAG: hypothetical protein JWP27_1198 [Flaviaesturariibacter sp.]|nr:hypothetical protein [Flaviaesturariibacter sp.]
MNTREKILDQALKLFNERGIEYVGLREIAAVLDLRVGNITDYFPTKDDLVHELSIRLGAANAAVMKGAGGLSLADFYARLGQVMQNHLAYRGLLVSVVHLMRQNRHLAVSYKETQAARNASLKSMLASLQQAGELRKLRKTELDFLVLSISLISRFWISEAALSTQDLTDDEQVARYRFLIKNLLAPYKKGMPAA